ncbi:MAG: glycosyltransferase family 2 protein [Deltaproteobacteria bacterium]|nr:glycosyltransferase family 2 protein [Deltaproteobacteria bacterium]
MHLSVIIPALNEYQYISNTVYAVRHNAVFGGPHEIIVVDSGSRDGTPEIAKRLGVKLIEIKPEIAGRFHALNKGASIATGDVLLFLDADTILPEGYDAEIKSALGDQDIVGGAFEFALDGKGFSLRVVELINRLRYRISHQFYGDQGIFVRATLFHRLGGYPKKGILEASDFCASLMRMGRLVLIRREVKTSPRRFLEGGVYRVLAGDIKIWWLDLMGKPLDHFANVYWKKNMYRDKKCLTGRESSNVANN